MKVDIVTFKQLFQQDVQYQVPIFQREYVWTLEDQWEALWEDIQSTAEEYLAKLGEFDGDPAKAQRLTRRHFMGAVVLQQKQGNIADTQKCDVIDGQQRITTVQLVLNAAKSVILEALGARAANNLEQLVVNRFGEGADRFKLWPALSDRDAFRYAMTEGAEGSNDTASGICAAHNYFLAQIQEWVNPISDMSKTGKASVVEGQAGVEPNSGMRAGNDVAEDKRVQEKVHALETTLLGLFEFVTIDLTVDDDANIIFEVLNARGTPLSHADLIKNYMLYAAEKEGYQSASDELYKDIWGGFADAWWNTEVRLGAVVRSQLDIFLNYYLSSVSTKNVRSHRVHPEFVEYAKSRKQHAGGSIRVIAGEINQYSRIYRSWYEYEQNGHPIFGRFFRRCWKCGLGQMSPLMLWLFAQRDHGLSKDELARIVGHIESFLMRRAICKIATAGLNKVNIELLRKVRTSEGEEIANTLVDALVNYRGVRRWPVDDEVEQAVINQPVYGRVAAYNIRTILTALEERKRKQDTYSQFIAGDLGKRTIEHIMPRAWHTNWPPPDDTAAYGTRRYSMSNETAISRRNRLLDTLGNLTLLTGKLNSHTSNGPWHIKRKAFRDHPGLHITQDVAQLEEWSDDAIEKRGQEMLHEILQIWPRPAPDN